MKSRINIVALMLLSAALVGTKASAQTHNLGVNVNASNSGIYQGIGYSETMTVTFTNGSLLGIAPNTGFAVEVSLPVGLNLSSTYIAPTGWNYQYINAQFAKLTATTASIGFPYTISFPIPFVTAAELESLEYSIAKVVKTVPSQYTDPIGTNDEAKTTLGVGGTPLPVNFSSFEAKANGCDVNLNWITSNEKENAYFNVERSANGTKFETIDKVASQGNSSNAKRYNFVDANPLTGKSFYRISQVDIDGKSTSTKMESVNVNCMVSTIEMYPNPATDFINVKGMQSGKNTVRVINVAGQVVAEEVAEVGQQQVNIAKLASGTYQVQVSNNDQVVFTGKFVKAK